MVPCVECLEVGDPLTAEELEEKERLLEEVSVFSQQTKFQRQALFNLVIGSLIGIFIMEPKGFQHFH